MAHPLDNLGDYNIARNDLKKFNGNIQALYKYVGDLAVKKAAPKHFVLGGVAFLAVGAVAQYGITLYRNRKAAIDEEPAVQAAFEDIIETCSDMQGDVPNTEQTSEEQPG